MILAAGRANRTNVSSKIDSEKIDCETSTADLMLHTNANRTNFSSKIDSTKSTADLMCCIQMLSICNHQGRKDVVLASLLLWVNTNAL
jgi:hypothetical protein